MWQASAALFPNTASSVTAWRLFTAWKYLHRCGFSSSQESPRYVYPFQRRFLAGNRIMLLMPFRKVSIPHLLRIAGGVVARRGIFARLRIVVNRKFGHFQNPLRSLKAIGLWSLAA